MENDSFAEKECGICGKLFQVTHKNQQYCPECRKHSGRKKAAMAEIMRKNASKYAAWEHADNPQLETLTCAHCGKEFQGRAGDTYCSKACAERHFIETARCGFCGRLLYPMGIVVKPHAAPAYCSDECREKQRWASAERLGNICTCLRCGKSFIRNGGGGKFCSKECYRAAARDGWRPEPNAMQPPRTVRRKCVVCGKPFRVEMGTTALTTCSLSCAQIYDKQRADEKKLKVKEDYIRKNGLCSICKVPYKDCIRMTSNFKYSPDGASFGEGSIIIKCPMFLE